MFDSFGMFLYMMPLFPLDKFLEVKFRGQTMGVFQRLLILTFTSRIYENIRKNRFLFLFEYGALLKAHIFN